MFRKQRKTVIIILKREKIRAFAYYSADEVFLEKEKDSQGI